MYSVCKSFTFDAAHCLISPYQGKCCRMHGHRWRVDITATSEILDPCGMVMDFVDFAPLGEYIRQKFDHAIINETVKQPTAENIARHLYEWARGRWPVTTVRVWETETAYAEYGI